MGEKGEKMITKEELTELRLLQYYDKIGKLKPEKVKRLEELLEKLNKENIKC